MSAIESQSITYELASRNEANELLSLYQEFYPELSWTEKYFEWQYFRNPNGEARTWVAKFGGTIVATYTAIPHEFYLQGKVRRSWRIQDVVTKSKFQGRGLYNNLSKIATEFFSQQEESLGFTFPKENSTSHNGFIRAGWLNAFQVPLFVCSQFEPQAYWNVEAKVRPLRVFDEKADDIWKAHARKIDFAIHRSSTFLNWRYLMNPKDKYFPFLLSQNGNEAILILKYYNREDGSRWAHVCDFFYREESVPLVESAVNQWFNFAQALGCVALSCWSMPRSLFSKILLDSGFSEYTSQRWWLVIKDNFAQSVKQKLCESNRWHLSIGDSDVF